MYLQSYVLYLKKLFIFSLSVGIFDGWCLLRFWERGECLGLSQNYHWTSQTVQTCPFTGDKNIFSWHASIIDYWKWIKKLFVCFHSVLLFFFLWFSFDFIAQKCRLMILLISGDNSVPPVCQVNLQWAAKPPNKDIWATRSD